MSNFVLLGIIFMLAAVLFQLVTLPVEFNASSRAMDQVVALGVITKRRRKRNEKSIKCCCINICCCRCNRCIRISSFNFSLYRNAKRRLKGKDRHCLSFFNYRSIGTLFSSSVKPSPMTS